MPVPGPDQTPAEAVRGRAAAPDPGGRQGSSWTVTVVGEDVEDGPERQFAETDAEADGQLWDEEESEALRQARKDAELTPSAASGRAYPNPPGKGALANAQEE